MIEPRFFFATVENRDDPLKMGRCQVRVDHVHPSDLNLVPSASLPWAITMNWIQSAGLSGVGWSPTGIMVGTRVFGLFLDGDDCQIPMIMGTVAGKTGHLTFPAVDQGANSAVTAPAKPSAVATNAPKQLGAVPQTSLQKATAIASRLKSDYGLTDEQAAGVLGNFLIECPGLVPNLNQGGRIGLPADGKTNGQGYSWAQWDGSRRQDMVAFCKKNSIDIQSDEAAYQWLSWELKHTKQRALTDLKKQTSLADSVSSWVSIFEVAGKPNTARRVQEGTKVLKSLKSADVPIRTVGVNTDSTGTETAETKVPNDQSPQALTGTEPLVKFRGKYPYNKTYRSESGHVMEIDDTPGHERLLNYHTAGTYEEIDEKGRRVVKVVSDNYTVIHQDDNLYVEGSVNIFVNGNVRAKVGGDLVADVGNEICLQSVGAIRMKGKSISMETTGGPINLKSATTISGQATGAMYLKSGGNFYQQSGADYTINIGGKQLSTVKGDFSVNATGKAYVNGAEVHWLESGGDAPVVNDTKGAGMNIALHQEELSFVLDDDFDGTTTQKAIDEGIITKEELDQPFQAGATAATPSASEVVKPAKAVTATTVTSAQATDPTSKISTYFKLGDVSSWAAASRTDIVAQRGLSTQDIAKNLQLLSVNCLDKIKLQYQNMVITSGFRKLQNGKSQHEIGQAADMQFSGMSNADLLDVATWIRDSSGIKFDQLILEHKSYGTKNSWIHISFDKNTNRQMAFTMWNNKTCSSNLVGHA